MNGRAFVGVLEALDGEPGYAFVEGRVAVGGGDQSRDPEHAFGARSGFERLRQRRFGLRRGCKLSPPEIGEREVGVRLARAFR